MILRVSSLDTANKNVYVFTDREMSECKPISNEISFFEYIFAHFFVGTFALSDKKIKMHPYNFLNRI